MTSRSLAQIARVLGGTVSGGSVLCPGPGHSPRDRSLSVTLSATAPDGIVVFSHAGDNWRSCRDHVLDRLGHAARQHRRPTVDRSSAAVQLWDRAKDPGSVVERYLSNRGLKLDDDLKGRVVRFDPMCPWRADDGSFERRLVMLTAFRTISDDRLVAVHRTLLSDEGRKLDRRMLGPVAGAAIKIDRDEDVEQGLHVAEGFESGLAGRMLGFLPVWALGSAGAIAAFPVLSGIDAITFLAETDDAGANARAVRACGMSWFNAGREVILATPQIVGDLNDVVMP
jgi:putative DNA primase/helicase